MEKTLIARIAEELVREKVDCAEERTVQLAEALAKAMLRAMDVAYDELLAAGDASMGKFEFAIRSLSVVASVCISSAFPGEGRENAVAVFGALVRLACCDGGGDD